MKNLGLLSWLSRKKLTDEQVANIFVNTSFDTVEQGWPQVAAFLNAAPEFDTPPQLDPEDYGKFLMIVVSANLGLIPKHFDPGVDRAIIQRCCAKFGFALGLPPDTFARKVKEFRAFMKDINRPSKNTLTAMTRAVCYKYDVIAHQEPLLPGHERPQPHSSEKPSRSDGTLPMGLGRIRGSVQSGGDV